MKDIYIMYSSLHMCSFDFILSHSLHVSLLLYSLYFFLYAPILGNKIVYHIIAIEKITDPASIGCLAH